MGCVPSGCFVHGAFARIVGDRVHHSGSKRYHRHVALENDYYQCRHVLGRGFSGAVMLGRSVQTEEEVAIKTLRVRLSDIMDNEKAIKHMAREVDVLLSVSHPNIVALADVYEKPASLTLVMELLK
ncbi:mlkA, partial [Symbiodinium microadriaticum]